MEETRTGKGVAYFLLHMIGAALYLLLGHTSSTNIVLDTCKANSSSNTVKHSLFSSKEIVYEMLFLWWLFFFSNKKQFFLVLLSQITFFSPYINTILQANTSALQAIHQRGDRQSDKSPDPPAADPCTAGTVAGSHTSPQALPPPQRHHGSWPPTPKPPESTTTPHSLGTAQGDETSPRSQKGKKAAGLIHVCNDFPGACATAQHLWNKQAQAVLKTCTTRPTSCSAQGGLMLWQQTPRP